MKLQREEVGELLFSNSYVGMLPVDTQDNPADEPSRSRPIRAQPEGYRKKRWVHDFLRGKIDAIDRVTDKDVREQLLFDCSQLPNDTIDRAEEWCLPAKKFVATGAPPAASLSELGERLDEIVELLDSEKHHTQ